MKPVTVSITDWHLGLAMAKGEGNVSEGIRKFIEEGGIKTGRRKKNGGP